MKIVKIVKTGIAIVGMGITYVVSKKFGDIAANTWNADDEDSHEATLDNLDEIDDEEIKEMVIKKKDEDED